MGEFRIGRSHAKHSYPDTPRAGGLAAFARNYAQSDTTTPVASTGTQVPWDTIESGAAAGVDVPITPHVTGRVRIIAMVVIANVTGAQRLIEVQAQVGGVTVPNVTAIASVDGEPEGGEAFETVTLLLDTSLLPVGSASNVEILLTADSDNALEVVNATIDIQELPAATG